MTSIGYVFFYADGEGSTDIVHVCDMQDITGGLSEDGSPPSKCRKMRGHVLSLRGIGCLLILAISGNWIARTAI